MSILGQPVNGDGTCRMYSSVVNEEMDKKRKAQLGIPDSRKQHCLRPTTQQVAGLVLNASPNANAVAASGSIINGQVGSFMPMTVEGANKENLNPLSDDYLDFVDNDVVDKLMASDPIARRALAGGNFNVTKGNSLTNTGGQSFMGATFSGCVFVSCTDPTEVAKVMSNLQNNSSSSSL